MYQRGGNVTCPCGRKKMPGAVWCYGCTKLLQADRESRRLYRLATGNGTALDLRHAARRGADVLLTYRARV